MEFNVTIDTRKADLARIDASLREVDPAAVVDARNSGLRIAGAFDVPGLVAVLRESGFDLSERDVEQVPSVCCGGCGG